MISLRWCFRSAPSDAKTRLNFDCASPSRKRPASWLLLALGLFAIHMAQAQIGTSTALKITVQGNQVTSVSSGTVVTLTAIVSAGGLPVNPGQVTFCDGVGTRCAYVGSAQLKSSGSAGISFMATAGNHSYEAIFAGKLGVLGSTSAPAALTATPVVPYQSMTAIVPTGSDGSYTLNTFVGGNGQQLPAGTVSFTDGASVIGTQTLGVTSAGPLLFPSTLVSNVINLPAAIAVADFNGDGIPDIAVGENYDELVVHLGQGDGTFLQQMNTSIGNASIEKIVCGDFNSDGITDLAIANTTSTGVVLGDGHGNFSFGGGLSANLSSIAIGDVNNDGIPDLIGLSTAGYVEVFLGNGDGTFSVGIQTGSGGGAGYPTYTGSSVVVADFNGDGKLDVAVQPGNNTALSVYLGNGDGTFTPGGGGAVSGSGLGLAVADFNRDGIPDLINDRALMIGVGDGSFLASALPPNLPQGSNIILAQDFNHDGVIDVVADGLLFFGKSDGSFASPLSILNHTYAAGFTSGDLNGDGVVDLVGAYAPQSPNPYSVILGLTSLNSVEVSQAVSLPVATGIHQVDAQYSGDSFFSASGALVSLSAAKATPTISLTSTNNPSGYGTPISLIATITGVGLTPAGSVTFSDSGKQLGVVGLAGGVATYSTSNLVLGQHPITASYSGDGDYTTGTASLNQVVQAASASITLTPSSLAAGQVGAGYSQALTAAGGTAPYSYAVTSGSLPAGLVLSTGGVLSGTPSASGSATFTVTATDSSSGKHTGSQNYSLTINPAPTITLTPSSLAAGQVGAGYSQALTAAGGTAPYSYAVTSGSLPAGLVLSAGGVLSGTPSASGSATFTVTATDSSSGKYTGSQNYSLTINPAPTITLTPSSLAAGQVGAGYSQALTAAGGTAPYSYAVTSGSLPAGLVLSTGGVLSGTPSASGSATFTVTATDSSSGKHTGSQNYTLTINPAPTITLTPSSLAAGQVGAGYSQALTAAGGTAPYSYAVTSGSLPAGLVLSTGGVLSGTPSASGAATFTVTATDSSSGKYTGSQNYSLTINPAPTITLTPSSLAAGQVGAGYSQALTAAGGTAPYSYAVTSGSLPTGLALSTGGVLSGTPSASGSATFTVTATDSSSGKHTGSQNYTLTINPAPTITLTPSSLAAGQVGAGYSQALTAAGGTAPYSYAVTSGSLPAGLVLSAGGVLSGTPSASGSATFTVTATDSSSGKYTGSQNYSLTINPAPTITLTPSSLAAGQVGAGYSQALTAAGGTAPYSYAVTSGSLPAGLVLSTGGVLSGTPSASGSATFTVTATDSSSGKHTGSQNYSLTINPAPTITLTPSSLAAGQVGAGYSQALTAAGGTAPYSYAVTSGSLPAGLVLSTGGVLSGTPSASGAATFTVTATDSSSGKYTGSQNYSLTINPAPTIGTITPSSPTTQTVSPGGSATFDFNIIATAGVFADPVSFSVTGLPPGATATFSPSSFPSHSQGGPVTLTIQTASTTAMLRGFGVQGVMGALLLPFACLWSCSRSKRILRNFGLMIAMVLMGSGIAALSGCGVTSNVKADVPNPTTYTITVHVLSGDATQTTNITLAIR